MAKQQSNSLLSYSPMSSFVFSREIVTEVYIAKSLLNTGKCMVSLNKKYYYSMMPLWHSYKPEHETKSLKFGFCTQKA